jgi:hypothetical protein
MGKIFAQGPVRASDLNAQLVPKAKGRDYLHKGIIHTLYNRVPNSSNIVPLNLFTGDRFKLSLFDLEKEVRQSSGGV